MDSHSIAGSAIRAKIKAFGAELCGLADAGGQEVLWPGTEPWPRHAPNLFPVVGRLKGFQLHHDGKTYEMGQHGFARDTRFTWVETSPSACLLAITDTPETRARYPFPFRFEVGYAAEGDTLAVTYRAVNTGDGVLPAAMGGHPAFRWPLVEGIAKDAHTLDFSAPEPAPLLRVKDGLLQKDRVPSPVKGSHLALNVGLFDHDALIFEAPASRSVRYTAPGAPVVEVSWDDGFPSLGVWSRADADLLCIEPWHGMSSPADFDGEFMDKPGLMLIPPGEAREATYRIRVSGSRP